MPSNRLASPHVCCATCRRILALVTKRVRLDPSLSLAWLAGATPGFVGADLVLVVREAALNAVSRLIDALPAAAAETAADADAHIASAGAPSESSSATALPQLSLPCESSLLYTSTVICCALILRHVYNIVGFFTITVLTVDVHVCAVDLRALKSSSSLTPEQLDTALITIEDFKVCIGSALLSSKIVSLNVAEP